ncbi:hypothetical protein EUGRSUZ_G02278 [Eucalyptus grandis]|uniref:Uncharacterized protein n=2 Tax=Eucalyptus grandis TaxID=71139 RepID=A0A059BG81_EUCGR|nr:hypothetical protein EUGRSUZ_G02278 [Eucalyptus grandis]
MDVFQPNPFCLGYTHTRAFLFPTVPVLLLFPSKIPEMGVESSLSSQVLLRLVIGILTILSLEDWVASASLKCGNCKPGKCSDVMIESERTGNACFAPPEESPRPPSAAPDTDVPGIVSPSFLRSSQGPLYLAFLRNCRSFPISDYPNPQSTCPSVGANHSFVALLSRKEDHLNQSACDSPVIIVPVKLAIEDSDQKKLEELAREDSEKTENDDSGEKGEHGIRLQWDLTSWEHCVKCQKSGRKCGGHHGRFRCRKGNTFRFIPCNSNS